MQRTGRVCGAPRPSLAATAAIPLFLIVFSMIVQPPRVEEADALQRALGWLRTGLFTGGAVAFIAALFALLRGEGRLAVSTGAGERSVGSRRPAAGSFTLVALGGTPDDTRVITDTADAEGAVRVLRQWATTHPEELVLIFAPDGEPIAFRRPASGVGVHRGGV